MARRYVLQTASSRGESPLAWTLLCYFAPVLNKQIIAENDQYIWADAKGSVRGQVIEPLDKRVAEITKNDPELYDMLALIDAIRVGKNREKEIAGKLLKEKIQSHALSYQ